jgi:hypothetical protein
MFNRRTWKYWIAGVALLAVAAFAYTPARQFHRFFLTECAADGPAPETELDKSKKIPLATENNLGTALATPGLMIEGSFMTTAKNWLGIYSLGEHTSAQNIPLITTEVPWSWPSMEERIEAQVTAALVALKGKR